MYGKCKLFVYKIDLNRVNIYKERVSGKTMQSHPEARFSNFHEIFMGRLLYTQVL